jgi:DNA-binding Xre family transcriptional regulator
MSQKKLLIETLKKALKQHGMQYVDVAQELNLHVGTIKRMFSNSDFSLDRLEKVCAMIHMELSDLVQMMNKSKSQINSLIIEQEELLVSDTKLLLIAHLLINNWEVKDILNAYEFDPYEMTRYLATLDRIKLIDLLPGDRVHLKTTRTFSWINDGPIELFFKKHVQLEFMQSEFKGSGELHLFMSGMLSRKSNDELQTRIKRIASTFNDLHREDEEKEVQEKFGTSMVVAMRPWDIQLFLQYRRPGTQKKY